MARRDRRGEHGGSAEASQWVKEAIANAREWFADLPEDELRSYLEQAFEFASQTARGKHEFHALFEAELRRAVEERAVVGSAESVLPATSAGERKAFTSVAAEPAEPTASDEVSEEDAPATPVDDRAPDVDRAADEDRPTDEDHARAFVYGVGALRFRDGLSPAEIQERLGIDPEYYAESMRWLLRNAELALKGEYPAHIHPGQMASHAAGLESAEGSISVETHVRECPGCAEYLADLLDATLRTVDPDSQAAPAAGERPTRETAEASPRPPKGAKLVSYTEANVWTNVGGRSRRQRRQVPAVSIRVGELRSYARSLKATRPEVAHRLPEIPHEEATPARRPIERARRPIERPRRQQAHRRRLPKLADTLGVAMIVTAVAGGIVSIANGDGDGEPSVAAVTTYPDGGEIVKSPDRPAKKSEQEPRKRPARRKDRGASPDRTKGRDRQEHRPRKRPSRRRSRPAAPAPKARPAAPPRRPAPHTPRPRVPANPSPPARPSRPARPAPRRAPGEFQFERLP